MICKSDTLFCCCSGPPSIGSVATPVSDDDILENPVNLLDAVYLENAIHMANELVQDNVNYWMGKYSECVMLLNNIKGLSSLRCVRRPRGCARAALRRVGRHRLQRDARRSHVQRPRRYSPGNGGTNPRLNADKNRNNSSGASERKSGNARILLQKWKT